jgi:hypothetical protein
MIAYDPSVTMAERMSFSRHNNPSLHIAYICAGHNSNFSFQKAVSGAPTMPNKKEILEKKSIGVKIEKVVKHDLQQKPSSPRTIHKIKNLQKSSLP